MNQFKIGQKIVCVDAKGTLLIEKEIYTVIGFHPIHQDTSVILAEGKNNPYGLGFWNWRFRPIDDSWVEKLIEEIETQSIDKATI